MVPTCWPWSQTPVWPLEPLAYLAKLAATSDTMFSRSKSSTSGHVTQDLDVVERPSVRHLVENLFLFKVRKFHGEILNGFGFVRI